MKKIVTLTARIVLGVVLGAGSLAAAAPDPTMPADQVAYDVAIKRAEAAQASLAAVVVQLRDLDSQYKDERQRTRSELSDERVRWYRVQSVRLQVLRDNLQEAVQEAVGCLALIPIPVPGVTGPVELAVTPEGVVTPPTHEAYTTVATPPAEHPGVSATDDQASVDPEPEPELTLVDRWLASPWTTVLYGAAGVVAYAATVSATGVQRVIAGVAGGIASAVLLKVVTACRRNRINHAHEA